MVLVVSLTTLMATVLLRRVIARPGGSASGMLLLLPLLLPILAAIIYQGGVLPEVTVLKPISAVVEERSESLLHLLFLSDGKGQAALYAFYGSAGAWIFLVGLAVSSVMLVRRICGALVLRRLISRCTAPEPQRDDHILFMVRHLAASFGLTPTPEVLILPPGVSGAFAAGLRRGRVLLSRDLIERLDDDELAAVVAHEIAHLEARDVPVVFAAGFLRDFVAWNPFAHIAFRRLLIDRELEADRRAASVTRSPLSLASGLVTVFKLMRGQRGYVQRGALALLRPRASITRRVTSLLAMADRGHVVDLRLRRGTYLAAALLVAALGLEAGAKLADHDSTFAFVWGSTTPPNATAWEPPSSLEAASEKRLSKSQRKKLAKAKKRSSLGFLLANEPPGTLLVADTNQGALSKRLFRLVNRHGIPAAEFRLRARPVPLWGYEVFGVYRIDQHLLDSGGR
ncbi:MAG: M48 family metalloprotease [Actinomycetota bacterium]